MRQPFHNQRIHVRSGQLGCGPDGRVVGGEGRGKGVAMGANLWKHG